MKYLVLLVVLVVAFGIWRSRRAPDTSEKKPSPSAHCGIHIPQAEALMLGNRAYCCAEHQRLGPA